MKPKYTIIGFIVAIIIGLLFGSLEFIKSPQLFCASHLENYRCTLPLIADTVLWLSNTFANLMTVRFIIWIATALPILIGFLIDCKIKQESNDNNISSS